MNQLKLNNKFKWNDQAVDGRKKDKCVGNGNVKGSEKKNEKENSEELEVNKW